MVGFVADREEGEEGELAAGAVFEDGEAGKEVAGGVGAGAVKFDEDGGWVRNGCGGGGVDVREGGFGACGGGSVGIGGVVEW